MPATQGGHAGASAPWMLKQVQHDKYLQKGRISHDEIDFKG
jgi:hypothetical protein